MAEVITMPRLSDTMEEGTVAKWHKKVGDKVSEGDILAEIETDKAVQEFESEFEGVLLYVGTEEGKTSPVDTILAIIGEEGEDITSLVEDGSKPAEKEETTESTENTEEETVEETSTAEIPDNVNIITMPRLSDTMTDGTVAQWHKQVGDKVSEGDILADIETDKAVQEFESEYDGFLLYVGTEEGGTSPVDTILAIIGPEGTDVSGIVSSQGKTPAAKKDKPEEEPKDDSPKPGQAPVEDDETSEEVEQTDGKRIFVSPLARKLAQEKGINLKEVKGSGDGGRIVKKDIENFKPAEKPKTEAKVSEAPKAEANPAQVFVQGEDKEVNNSQMRKVIAKRLAESKFTAPHYYLNVELDMDNAIAARTHINAVPDTKVSFNDIVVKAVAAALKKHPQVNSSWKGDTTVIHGDINIGVAVAVEDGLLVPVVKNTDQKSLSQIAAEVRDLAGRARDRKLKADEMEKSTFSVSNLGMFGIESFTSIINQPNSCILSVGAIIQKPVVKDGQIVVGNTMKLSLACDHRTVDGATGALFLQTLKTYIENPVTILI